ncbi:hypothetical protein [Lysobacter capsici]|uniref:hypothetical protein n=1 Tax=Lysobacter capsici TaxID=435897 RepID=UPI00207AD9BB|nr:hypothetical protein [Lysobacter capsici]
MLRRVIRAVGGTGRTLASSHGFIEQLQERQRMFRLRRPTSRIFDEIGTKFADGVGMFRWHAQTAVWLAVWGAIMAARTMTM